MSITKDKRIVQPFEVVPHTADLQIRAYGATLEALFSNALLGMFSSIKPKGSHIQYKDDRPHVSHFSAEHHVALQAPDREILLVDFLSESLYLSDVYNEAYFEARFKILSNTELEGTIYGVGITGFEEVEIKAVTYHGVDIRESDTIWQATIIFDI